MPYPPELREALRQRLRQRLAERVNIGTPDSLSQLYANVGTEAVSPQSSYAGDVTQQKPNPTPLQMGQAFVGGVASALEPVAGLGMSLSQPDRLAIQLATKQPPLSVFNAEQREDIERWKEQSPSVAFGGELVGLIPMMAIGGEGVAQVIPKLAKGAPTWIGRLARAAAREGIAGEAFGGLQAATTGDESQLYKQPLIFGGAGAVGSGIVSGGKYALGKMAARRAAKIAKVAKETMENLGGDEASDRMLTTISKTGTEQNPTYRRTTIGEKYSSGEGTTIAPEGSAPDWVAEQQPVDRSLVNSIVYDKNGEPLNISSPLEQYRFSRSGEGQLRYRGQMLPTPKINVGDLKVMSGVDFVNKYGRDIGEGDINDILNELGKRKLTNKQIDVMQANLDAKYPQGASFSDIVSELRNEPLSEAEMVAMKSEPFLVPRKGSTITPKIIADATRTKQSQLPDQIAAAWQTKPSRLIKKAQPEDSDLKALAEKYGVVYDGTTETMSKGTMYQFTVPQADNTSINVYDLAELPAKIEAKIAQFSTKTVPEAIASAVKAEAEPTPAIIKRAIKSKRADQGDVVDEAIGENTVGTKQSSLVKKTAGTTVDDTATKPSSPTSKPNFYADAIQLLAQDIKIPIKYRPDLDIRNLDQLPRGTGSKYLVVIKGEKGEYVAKRWARKSPELADNEHLIYFEAKQDSGLKAIGEKPAALDAGKVSSRDLGSEGYIQAIKDPDGKYRLFFRGTRNEIFPNQRFASASEARQYWKAENQKAIDAGKVSQEVDYEKARVGDKVYFQSPNHRKPHKGRVTDIVTMPDGSTKYEIESVAPGSVGGRFMVDVETVKLPKRTIVVREYHGSLKSLSVPEREIVKNKAKQFDDLLTENSELFIDPRAQQQTWEKTHSQTKKVWAADSAVRDELRETASGVLGLTDLNSPVQRSNALTKLEQYIENKTPKVPDVKAEVLHGNTIYKSEIISDKMLGDLPPLKHGDRVKLPDDWYEVQPSETPGNIKLKDGRTLEVDDTFTELPVEEIVRPTKFEQTSAGQQGLLTGTESRQVPSGSIKSVGKKASTPINQGDVFSPDKIKTGNLPQDQTNIFPPTASAQGAGAPKPPLPVSKAEPAKAKDASEWTRDDVAKILASQPHNVGKNISQLADRWIGSERFTKMEIPTDAVGMASTPSGLSRTKGPIIVDINISETGRIEGKYGTPPDVLVIDGKHRLSEAIKRGDKTIIAMVGERAIPHIKKALSSAEQNRNSISLAVRAFADNPNGGTLRDLEVLLPKKEIIRIRQSVKDAKQGLPVPPSVLADYPDLAAKYGKGKAVSDVPASVPTPIAEASQGATPKPTELHAGVNPFEEIGKHSDIKALRAITGVKNRIQSQEGKAIVGEMEQSLKTQARLEGTWANRLYESGLGKLNQNELDTFRDVVERRIKPISEQQGQVVNEWRGIMSDVLQQARDSGMEVGEIADYFARHLKRDVAEQLSGDFNKLRQMVDANNWSDDIVLQKLEEWAMNTKGLSKATKTAIEAAQNNGYDVGNYLLRLYDLNRNEGILVPFGNLEKRRLLNLPSSFYETDPRIVASSYLNGAAKRIAESQTFGADLSGLTQAISAVKNPNDLDALVKLEKLYTGKLYRENALSPEANRWVRRATNLTVAGKIGTGFANLLQVTQPLISLVPKAGLWRTMQGAVKLADPELRREIRQSGAGMYADVIEMLMGHKQTSGVTGTIAGLTTRLSGFSGANKVLQYLAASTGKVYINDLRALAVGGGVRSAWAKKTLAEFGIDATKPFTREMEQEAMYKFAMDSQLQKNILRDPVWMNDPRLRPFALFKRFGFRQAEYIKNDIFKEWQNGNVLPTLRLLAGGIAGGEAMIWAKNEITDIMTGASPILPDELRTKNPRHYRTDKLLSWQRAVNDLAAIGSLGTLSDLLRSDETGWNRVGDYAENIAFAASPALLDAPMSALKGQAERPSWMRQFTNEADKRGAVSAFTKLFPQVTKSLSPVGGRLTDRLKTEKQIDNSIAYAKGKITTQIAKLTLDGNREEAMRQLKLWNQNHKGYGITSDNIGNAIRNIRLMQQSQQ